jgi:DNA polymerase-1
MDGDTNRIPRLILVDANAIAHIAKWSMKNLSFEDKATGVIFGFFNHIIKFAELFESNRFIFAWDSGTSFRKIFYEDYKANRNTKNEEQQELDEIAYPQFEALKREILPTFGFKHIFSQHGHEADDIIASVCKHDRHHRITIISTDKDMFQLIDEHQHVYDPRAK